MQDGSASNPKPRQDRVTCSSSHPYKPDFHKEGDGENQAFPVEKIGDSKPGDYVNTEQWIAGVHPKDGTGVIKAKTYINVSHGRGHDGLSKRVEHNSDCETSDASGFVQASLNAVVEELRAKLVTTGKPARRFSNDSVNDNQIVDSEGSTTTKGDTTLVNQPLEYVNDIRHTPCELNITAPEFDVPPQVYPKHQIVHRPRASNHAQADPDKNQNTSVECKARQSHANIDEQRLSNQTTDVLNGLPERTTMRLKVKPPSDTYENCTVEDTQGIKPKKMEAIAAGKLENDDEGSKVSHFTSTVPDQEEPNSPFVNVENTHPTVHTTRIKQSENNNVHVTKVVEDNNSMASEEEDLDYDDVLVESSVQGKNRIDTPQNKCILEVQLHITKFP